MTPQLGRTENIVLIGYRGCGKSTVSDRLASRLGWDALDADAELERRSSRTIAEWFAKEGEAAFRAMESQLLAEFVTRPHAVIAAGGGAVISAPNRKLLRQAGWVVWLQARPAALWARIADDATTADRRPNLTSQGGPAEVERLLAERTPWYEACADLHVSSEDRDPDAIVSEIAHAVCARHGQFQPA